MYCCSILQQKECCTLRNGEYIKAGLDELELWCGNAQEEVLFQCISRLVFLSAYVISLNFSSISLLYAFTGMALLNHLML